MFLILTKFRIKSNIKKTGDGEGGGRLSQIKVIEKVKTRNMKKIDFLQLL